MTTTYGYSGEYLKVDLTEGSIERIKTDSDVAAKFIGGLGYATYLLWTMSGSLMEPLSPESNCIINTGPITGLLCANRLNFTFKSPISGLVGHSQLGGNFASELKFAGYDGIILTGRADSPVYLSIRDDCAEIREAKGLWRRNPIETDIQIMRNLSDPRTQVLSIGISGENSVKLATVQHKAHTAARTGVGAVLGSKNLKAIAVRGTLGIKLARPDEVFEIMDRLMHEIWSPKIAEAKGGTFELNRFGTTRSYLKFPDSGTARFRNYLEGDSPEAGNLAAAKLRNRNHVRNDSCAFCPVGCFQTFVTRSGDYAGSLSQLDWDSGGCLSYPSEITNIDGLLYLNSLCDDLGLDAEEAGNVAAWAIECCEKGILTEADFDGLDMTWGNVRTVAKLIWKIAHRQGVGDLLADGFKGFLPRFKTESRGLAMQSKFVGFGGVHPFAPLRGAFYATNDIGGHHENPTFSSWWSNSLTLCRFIYDDIAKAYAATRREYITDMLNAATGWRIKHSHDFDKFGKRGLVFLRAYNIREGYGGVMPPSEADLLPERIYGHTFTYGFGKGITLTKERFLAERAKLYSDLGCDERGIPTRETLMDLDLRFTITQLEAANAWE